MAWGCLDCLHGGFVLDLRMLGLREWSCRWVDEEDAHDFGALLELWSTWRRSIGPWMRSALVLEP